MSQQRETDDDGNPLRNLIPMAIEKVETFLRVGFGLSLAAGVLAVTGAIILFRWLQTVGIREDQAFFLVAFLVCTIGLVRTTTDRRVDKDRLRKAKEFRKKRLDAAAATNNLLGPSMTQAQPLQEWFSRMHYAGVQLPPPSPLGTQQKEEQEAAARLLLHGVTSAYPKMDRFLAQDGSVSSSISNTSSSNDIKQQQQREKRNDVDVVVQSWGSVAASWRPTMWITGMGIAVGVLADLPRPLIALVALLLIGVSMPSTGTPVSKGRARVRAGRVGYVCGVKMNYGKICALMAVDAG